MLDCSRNAVFTVEKVKSFIRIMAKLGMNTLMLYTEETYTVPDEPYFGAYRGRYSQDEIREMDAYARTFGIELVPCIQTLAHLHNALKWPLGDTVKDTADILQVGKEEVYTLIEKMLRSVKSPFPPTGYISAWTKLHSSVLENISGKTDIPKVPF